MGPCRAGLTELSKLTSGFGAIHLLVLKFYHFLCKFICKYGHLWFLWERAEGDFLCLEPWSLLDLLIDMGEKKTEAEKPRIPESSYWVKVSRACPTGRKDSERRPSRTF